MPELIQTLKSMKEREADERKFLASLKGIDLEIEEDSSEGSSFDDVRRRALGINASSDDVKSLQGQFAAEAGFGIGMGLGYIEE